jgi:hypothetical protein
VTAEDELREIERTLATYRDTLKEVNRLGGDGMAAVRDEWLLRIKELELQRGISRTSCASTARGSVSQRPGGGGRRGASREHAELRAAGVRQSGHETGSCGFDDPQKPRFQGGTPPPPNPGPSRAVLRSLGTRGSRCERRGDRQRGEG